jgi:hypothetical protein
VDPHNFTVSGSTFLVSVLSTHPRIPVKWCLDNSISSQIPLPTTLQDLSAALISALESNTVSPVTAPNNVVYDILLAEDNLVNQQLAVKILEKYGHTVEIAENGSLAVDAYKGRVQQHRPFDLILVCHSWPHSCGLLLSGFFPIRWTSPCRLWAVWKLLKSSEHMRRTWASHRFPLLH